MVADLGAFCMEYYLRSSDWLKLVGWLAEQDILLELHSITGLIGKPQYEVFIVHDTSTATAYWYTCLCL